MLLQMHSSLDESPDLNPRDFFVWGHMKQLLYAEPVNSEEFRHRVEDATRISEF
jgi:hypothetical protein